MIPVLCLTLVLLFMLVLLAASVVVTRTELRPQTRRTYWWYTGAIALLVVAQAVGIFLPLLTK